MIINLHTRIVHSAEDTYQDLSFRLDMKKKFLFIIQTYYRRWKNDKILTFNPTFITLIVYHMTKSEEIDLNNVKKLLNLFRNAFFFENFNVYLTLF